MAFATITRSIAAGGNAQVTVPGTGDVSRFRFVAIYIQNAGTGDAYMGSAQANGLRLPAGMAQAQEFQVAPGDVLTFWAGTAAVSDLRLGMAYQ